MSELQIFQILGLAFFSAGLGLLINPEFYKKMVHNLGDYPMFFYLSGLMSLTVGYLLVSFHNVWVWDRALWLTLIGWIALAKGAFIIIFPTACLDWLREMGEKYLPVKAIAASILGLIFLALGFFI